MVVFNPRPSGDYSGEQLARLWYRWRRLDTLQPHRCRVMPRVYSGRMRYTWGCGTWGRDIVLLARPDQGRVGAWRRRRVADTYHAMAGAARIPLLRVRQWDRWFRIVDCPTGRRSPPVCEYSDLQLALRFQQPEFSDSATRHQLRLRLRRRSCGLQVNWSTSVPPRLIWLNRFMKSLRMRRLFALCLLLCTTRK